MADEPLGRQMTELRKPTPPNTKWRWSHSIGDKVVGEGESESEEDARKALKASIAKGGATAPPSSPPPSVTPRWAPKKDD